VNAATAAAVPGLFARNERVVLIFEGSGGPFAVILVGALFVGSMTTVWHGDVTPRRPRRATLLPATGLLAPLDLARGAELGRFNMGSTVILLFGKNRVELGLEVVAGRRVVMGEPLGKQL
ncbi:MAG: phosphatidylserine decarboxylase, partial [Pseudomonadota bacterium]